MTRYVLDHRLEGERERLALMSRLLDPMHRRYIEALGIGPGARTLEVGCGNGSVSGWLAERVGRRGQAVAVDLDLSLVDVRARHLEVRQADITTGPIEPKAFDLVTARAVLHHLAAPDTAIANMVESLREGGALLLIEPDFLPVAVTEPEEVRNFWEGWLAWSREQGIDYYICRTLPVRLARQGVNEVEATAETAIYRGGSPWSTYWSQTVSELRPRLIESDKLDSSLIDAFLRHSGDPDWWTQSIAFTVTRGRAPRG